MSPVDRFPLELHPRGHTAYVLVALSHSWCAHGESVDASRSVWPRASESLYFIKYIQGCLAARHRAQL